MRQDSLGLCLQALSMRQGCTCLIRRPLRKLGGLLRQLPRPEGQRLGLPRCLRRALGRRRILQFHLHADLRLSPA